MSSICYYSFMKGVIYMLKPFEPQFLPISLANEDIIHLYKLATETRVKIERFNLLLERSPVSEAALMFFSLNESIESTKIEGTQATFSDIMEAEITGRTNNDIQEVNNYFDAINHGKERLNVLPISTRLFHELHSIILKDSRGENRSPGEYRKIQNFIGPSNSIKDATYIPPEPSKIDLYMSNLEKYINEVDDDLDVMIRVAIIHGQFETIHPYLDGNGRLGRMLILLYLLDKKVISKPAFFISEELEKNKYKYYGLLNNLRVKDPKWKEWIEFFLISSIKQADKDIDKLRRIEELFMSMLKYADENGIREDIIFFAFRKPLFTIKDAVSTLSISYNTAHKHVKKLLETGKFFGDDKQRNKIYRFYDLLDILNN